MGKRDGLFLFLIFFIVLAFFLPLFWPTPQLLVTPDFGKSDAWHFSFATKYALWESLHEGRLPLWEPRIGGGFPLFAEGQTGALFLPNLIFFSLSNPVTAYNLALVFAIVTLGWGMYVWLRSLALSTLPAFFGGITMALSGIAIAQLPHITLLQGFSLLPWVLWTFEKKSVALCAFFISQQIFAGFPQASFISILFGLSYGLWRGKIPLAGILLGIGLSAIQLFPSWEFLKNTPSPKGLPPDTAAYFSFPLKHLITFVNPFALGNPKFGTYPHFADFDGSIFWENTGYIGLLPLLLIFIALRFRTRYTFFFLTALVVSFLLMWGSHSPLYILYSLWPFNLFRVPSRFIWIFVMAAVSLASFGLAPLKRIGGLLVAVHLVQLFSTWRTYHLLVPAETWLAKPDTKVVGRIHTTGSEEEHNKYFLSAGWRNPDTYSALRKTLAADSTIVWNISSTDVYAGRVLRRNAAIDSLLPNEKLLDLLSVQTIVSPEGVVTNPDALPRAYVAKSTTHVETLEEATRHLTDTSFDPHQTVLIEQDLSLVDTSGIAILQKESSNTVEVAVETAGRTLLVLTDTYYPGWIAKIDGSDVPIIPVNLRHRGVVVPGGNHTVTFTYQPKSFKIGALVTILLGVSLVFFSRPHRFSKELSPSRYRPHNRAL